MALESSLPPPEKPVTAIQPTAGAPAPADEVVADAPKGGSRRKQVLVAVGVLLVVYLVVAYLVMPFLWNRYTNRHPSLADIPGITHTKNGIPGDPVNVALIGTQAEVLKIMVAAKWYPADPLTLHSCLEIAAASVLKHPYDKAPVSNLILFDRKQDLAFEQPVSADPRQRHHVRFWKTDRADPAGRPLWVGAAIFDQGEGFSHTTGQVTHHTAADIDTERDKLFRDLEQTGYFSEVFLVPEFHKILNGHNGGGDPWHTDGSLHAGVIKSLAP
jgi:hypothetical protein